MTAIAGGKLVIPDGANAGYIKQNATASAINVIGVAQGDAGPRTNQAGQNPANMAQAPEDVAVLYNVDLPMLYSSACAFMEALVADNAGGVKAFTSGTSTYDMIVGVCTEPAGVAASGTRARAWIKGCR
jgi:hypothetical protein